MPIVCGTDFSERSGRAAAAAGALATRIKDTELWLVHVLDPAADTLEDTSPKRLTLAAGDKLAAAAQSLQERTRVRVHHCVLHGPPAETLVRFAEAKGARVLVVASQGHGTSPLYRIGGTSERIAQSASVPVLVVRDPTPFEAWGKGDRPLRILLGADWSQSSDPAIRWVGALREAGACDVTVGHVYYPAVLRDLDVVRHVEARHGATLSQTLYERDRAAEQRLERELARRVGKLPGGGETTCRPYVGIGRLGDHLIELAEMERADLIVLGSHQKKGLARLASVASVTLHYSHASVAVVPLSSRESSLADVPSIRRVLIPTDFSPSANSAVPFGYALLGGPEGEVYLLHALPDARSADTADIAARLRSLVPVRGVPGAVATRTEVVAHANAAHAILAAAERLGVDLICMGSHGHSRLRRALLGSVAEAVVRESVRPVAVIPSLPL